MEILELVEPYKCSKCGQDTLVFITNRNTRLNYKDLMSNNRGSKYLKEYLASRGVTHIKCLSCGIESKIDCTDIFPIQLNQDKIDDFINQ